MKSGLALKLASLWFADIFDRSFKDDFLSKDEVLSRNDVLSAANQLWPLVSYSLRNFKKVLVLQIMRPMRSWARPGSRCWSVPALLMRAGI